MLELCVGPVAALAAAAPQSRPAMVLATTASENNRFKKPLPLIEQR